MARSTSQPTRTLRFSFLGLGFFWSWTTSVWIDLPLGGGAALHGTGSPWFFAQAATGIAFFALAALVMGRRKLPMNVGAATLLCIAGSLIVALALKVPSIAMPATLAGAAVMGCGSAWLQLLWTDTFERCDAAVVELAIPSSGFATVICMAVDSLITGPARFGASLAFAAVSGLLLVKMRATQEGDARCATGGVPRLLDDRRGIAAPIAVFFCTGLVFSVAAAASSPTSIAMPLVDDVPVLIGGLFSIALCLFVFHHSVRIDMVGTFRWMTPLVSIGVLCLMAPGEGLALVGRTLLAISEMAMVICVYVCFIEAARSRQASGVVLVGLVLGGYQLGLSAGAALFEVCGTAGLDTAESLGITLALFLLGTILIPARRPHRAGGRAAGDECETRNPLDAASVAVARACNLTQREEEIMALLAKGRSQPYIRDALFLSQNTIATYVKSIYKKLGVHSKQELIDLVSKTAEEGR